MTIVGDNGLTIFPPLYLMGMKIACWNCEKKLPVVAILVPNIEDTDNQVRVLSNILGLPAEVLDYNRKRMPTFQFRYSRTVGSRYFANTCRSCGSLFGDFYLQSEPGAPFFPTGEKEAGLLYLTEIPIQGPVCVQAGCHMGVGELILSNAKQIA